MKLLLDFGNTRVKAALLDGAELRLIYTGVPDLKNLAEAVDGWDISGGMWCTVRPLPYEIVSWAQSLGLAPFTADIPQPLQNEYATPQTLGMDRLAAAIGAWSIKPNHNLLVIDAGTAITFDFISSQGIYKGGAISPGINLRFRALHEFTGALPLVTPLGDSPLLGYNTETSIRCGVLNGVRNEIESYIEKLNSYYPSLLIFLTGGDAEYFDIKLKNATFAVPDLVLHGLARIIDYNEGI